MFCIKNNEFGGGRVCRLELKLTVQIISIIAYFSASCVFISALGKRYFFFIIMEYIFISIFLIVSFYTFYSTINLKHNYANIGYVIYSILI